MASYRLSDREIDEALKEYEEDELAVYENPLDEYNYSPEKQYAEDWEREKELREESKRIYQEDDYMWDNLYKSNNSFLDEDDDRFYEDVDRAIYDDI